MLALNAQFGVGAGGKRGIVVYLPCLRSQGAPQWHGDTDPAYAETCSCAGRTRYTNTYQGLTAYESGLNLYCGAITRSRPARGAVCSVACLEWANADRGNMHDGYGHIGHASALEILPAKEAKRRFDCCGKHLGCPETALCRTGQVGDCSTD